MLVTTDRSLKFPIRIVRIQKNVGDELKKSDVLFEYEYTTMRPEGPEMIPTPLKCYADFEAGADGTLTRVVITKDQVITQHGVPLFEVKEACSHDVQYMGMCGNCGMDMEEVDYTSTRKNTQRAGIVMNHNTTDLRVSANEASRAEGSAMRRLLKSRKLSLVVDLDQTIIHAVCDPTVGEWQNDESNPNHEAVKDVQSFELQDEGPRRDPSTYYIKMRPGLKEFLEEMSQIYELHIYTMGTRSYAENVARIVDPKGNIFADRILSRDESGSMSAKDLRRLFPFDTNMVVIIDDRGDVWSWSPNLIRVKAFNFYPGQGDINASFLPQLDPTADTSTPAPAVLQPRPAENTAESTNSPQADSAYASASASPSISIEDQLVAMAGSTDPSTVEQQETQHAEQVAAQVQERPLLRQQEQLDRIEVSDANSEIAESEAPPQEDGENAEAGTGENRPASRQSASTHSHQPLLRNDDDELIYLTKHLANIHENFFSSFDAENEEKTLAAPRVSQLKGARGAKRGSITDGPLVVPDVKIIIPKMKLDVLRGVVICFTGVIPQGIPHQHSDIGFWALSFGARINPNLTKSTTHVIAEPTRRTSKVRLAAKYSHIFIIDRHWLAECFSRWQRVSETPYLIEVETDNRPIEDLPGESSELLSDDEADVRADRSGDSKNDTGTSGETDDDMESVDLDAEGNPIPALTGIDEEAWEGIDAELAEFMNSSDSEDGDDKDDDDGDSSHSDNSQDSQKSLPHRKRKRGEADPPRTAAEEAAWGESDLQKRKKRAFERTSSLTKVENATYGKGLNGKKGAIPTIVEPAASKAENGNGMEQDEEDDDDDGDDGLEAMMKAALEESDEDEAKGVEASEKG
ncbi:hypothetical protein BT63DRAFT_432285 [Microthyrium microscopicum]|uniref:RNA polymerase II subunit A C-terminal domain phosphatase n=1 Tax=Microthyrium microscopicum TaxID=703497 RepID=A0A6A6UFW1_9PEZI|nr:hypothetical protein BT63DRAFT_432285 [Microthyrium microscopicum]